MKKAKLPWIKFWPGAHLNEPSLKLSSLSARGLWADLWPMMVEAPTRGILTMPNGDNPTIEQIAKLVGSGEGEVKAAMNELEKNGVFSRTEDGAVFSRRIVRETAALTKSIADGKRGGNPLLLTGPEPESDPKVVPIMTDSDREQLSEGLAQLDRKKLEERKRLAEQGPFGDGHA